ncbi:MAG: hypothetical protein LBE35_05895, partial [Clostridiales bacterium]|nr:hypothetical protein [Clostridiales bacterium]
MGIKRACKKIVAWMLAVIMAFGIAPLELLAEIGGEGLPPVEIIGFEPPAEYIAHQTVPFGTPLEQIYLPLTLTATVRIGQVEEVPTPPFVIAPEGAENNVIPAEAGIPQDGEGIAGQARNDGAEAGNDGVEAGNDGAETGNDGVEAGNDGVEAAPEGENGGQNGDSGSLNGAKNGVNGENGEGEAPPYEPNEQTEPADAVIDDINPVIDGTDPQTFVIQVPVSWHAAPIFDSESAGVYVFTATVGAGFVLADGVFPPVITVTVLPRAEAESIKIIDFMPLDAETAEQTVEFGTRIEQLNLPQTLTAVAVVYNEETELQAPVTWQSEPEFNGFAGEFIFTATVGAGFTLAPDVYPPQITVEVVPLGIMPLVDDVAALRAAADTDGSGDIVLTGNITITDLDSLAGLHIRRSLTLDLAGYTLTITVDFGNGINIAANNTLTIMCSSGDDTGQLIVTSRDIHDTPALGAGINTTGATLIINSG